MMHRIDMTGPDPNAARIDERTAIESVASILRLLVANGAVAPSAARRTMAGSACALADPHLGEIWRDVTCSLGCSR